MLPPIEELWGLVANEAVAAGRHSVVSEASGVAASIGDMEGVILCDPIAADILARMRDSREQWHGLIANLAILECTPEWLADVCQSDLLR